MNLLKKAGLLSLLATGCASLDENPRYHAYLMQADRDNQIHSDKPKALLIYSYKDTPLFMNKFDTAKREELKQQYDLRTIIAKNETDLYGAILRNPSNFVIGLAGSFVKNGMILNDCLAETCAFTLPQDANMVQALKDTLPRNTAVVLYTPYGEKGTNAQDFAQLLRTNLKRNIIVK